MFSKVSKRIIALVLVAAFMCAAVLFVTGMGYEGKDVIADGMLEITMMTISVGNQTIYSYQKGGQIQVTQVELSPNATLSFEFTWEPTPGNGSRLSLGDYFTVNIMNVSEHDGKFNFVG